MKNKHIKGIIAKGNIVLLGFCLFNTFLFSQVNSACFNSHNDNAFLTANAAQGFDVADFNNDGKLDLAFVSFLTSGNLLTIKMGNGNGTFQANVTYNVGVRPNSIRAKDLDADGDIDIAISNQTFSVNNAKITVLFNNGSGVFGSIASYSGSIPGPSPSAPNMFELDINDVTGDGLVDIVVAVNNGFEVFTNLGGSPAIFQSPTFTNATNSSSRGLIVANFDGVVGNDVVTANYGSPNFSLRTNNGSGTFNTAVNYACSSNPIDIATADFDADGDLDIVTANEAFDQISIFLNNGSGNFGTQTVMAAGDAPSSVKCADVNNDGKVDIIVTNGNSNTLSICNGNGNGTFQAKYEIIAIATPKNLAVGDFDGDSKTDVITSTQTQGISQFFKGSTTGLKDFGINYSTNSIVKHLTSSDLNNDGKNDVLVANGTANSFDVYFSLGNAVYNTVPTTYTIPGSTNPTIIQSNFLNNSDADKDVAVYYAGSTKVTVFNGSPTGTLTSFASFTPGAAVNNFAFEQLVGITTNKDFVLARNDGQIEIRENDGSASFPVFQTLSTGATSVSFVTVKDLNNDGFNDIITANGTSNTISVFLYNTGSNNFNSAVNLSTPANSTPSFLDVKDLNNDGFADIVSANSGTIAGFSRFLNNGSGGFGTIQTSANTGSAVKSVHILDFNNDGNQDIGITSQNGANTTGFIEVFMGNGSGTFGVTPTPFKKFSTEVGTIISNANDFNEDSRPDFVVLNDVSKSFNLILNATPWINAAGPTTFCSGNSVIINSKIQENYLWSPNGETTQNITATTSGSYYLTSSVGKTGWCTSNSMNPLTITVTPGPSAPTISAGGSTNVCAGDSLVLTSSSTTNNLWSTGDTTQSITVHVSGNYTCSIVSGGCQSNPSNSITVNVADAPVITPSGPVTACSGSIVLNSSIGGSFILWSNGTTTQTNTVTTTGNYFVTYSVPGCPSVNSNTVSVTIGNLATPTISPSGTVNFCSGGNVTLTSSSPNFNVWSTGATTQSITVSTGGTYSLHLDDGTCTSGNTSVIVNEISNPNALITTSGSTTFCSGGSVILTANSGVGLSYQWQLNGSNISGQTAQTYTANATGNYTVVVTNSNGCSSTSSPTAVTVNPTPSISLGTVTNPTTCGGTDGSITVSGTGTGDLAWTGTASGSATGITLPFNISSLAAGSYSISYTENGCVSNTLSPTLNNPSGPLATITPASATTFCLGGSVVLNANTGAGLSYQWQENGTDLSGETSSSYTATTSGNYTVVVTQAACPTTSSVTTVTVNPLPTATITAGGPTTFCSGDSVVLTTNAGAGLSYQWLLNGTALAGETSISYTATTSGIYSVEVTQSGCSTTSLNDTIVVNPTPAITLGTVTNPTTCGGTDGSITVSGTGTGDLAWTGTASGSATGITLPFNISSLAAGSYSISYTENGCVSNTLSPTLNNPGGPLATITPASATTFCLGGSVVLNANTGAGLSYQWQENGTDLSGETSSSYTATTSGNYTVVVTQAACPTTSSVTTVTVNPLPTATISAGGPTTFCSGDSVVLTANAGAGLSYQWLLNGTALAGETSISYTASTSGIYSVEVTQSGCSTTSLNDTIVVNPTPAITLGTVTNPTTCGGTDGSITVSGTGTGDLAWTGTASGSATGITLPFNISSLAAGSYSIAYTENGCVSNTLSPTLNNPSGPSATITPASATTFCLGGSVVLNANTGAGLSYQWQENGTDLSGETSSSYTATTSGNYTVIVTQAACPTTSSVTTVTVNPLPVATITAAGPTTFCSGGSVVLTANAGAGLSYQWLLNGTALAGETSISYTATTSGIYSVEVTQSGCSTTSLNDTIVVNPTPAITLGTVTNPTTCGGTDGSITVSGTGTGDLAWTGTASGSATGITLPFNISSLAAGSYSISYTENGCVSNTLSPTLNNPSGPSATITPASATTFCLGGSVVLNANTGAGLSYQWQENGTDLSGETSSSYTATTSGNYTVVVTQAACPTTSSVTTVTVNPLPTATITAGGPTTFCSGGSVVLTANAGAGLSYQWFLNGTALAGETSISYTATTSGIYSVEVTQSGCSTTSLNDTIVVNPTPAITLGTVTNPTTCGGTDGSITVSGTGTGDLAWTGTASGSATGITLPFNISSLAAGSYSITYTENGCISNTLSPTLNNPGGPSATITPASATTFCLGGSVVLNANTGAGLSYQWQENGTDLSGETSSSYTATTSGNYTVVVTQAACPTTSSVTTVTVNPLPTATITAGGPTTFCSGGSVVLTANAGVGLSYQWQLNGSNISGENSLSYTATTAGNYTVVVTNSNGCISTSAITAVTLNSLPTASITAAGSTSFCSGGSVVLNANTGAGLSYQWYLNGSILPGEIASSYTATTAGNYYVVITNTNSCSATSNTISTIVNSNPIATVSPSGSASICLSGSIVLTANTGSGLSYQWLFNGSPISLATSSTYTASSVGNYQVIVTNSSSCSSTSTITAVSLGSSPTASITAGGSTTFCSGNSVLLSANTGSGLTYIWKLNGSVIPSATASTYSATASGDYTVLITNSGGCSTLSNSITVTVNPLPPSPSILNGTTAFFCPGGSVVLNSSSATGNNWSNSLTSPSITVNTPGTYTLSIIDGNGCQSLSSSACNVSVLSAPPVPVITPSGPTTFCAGGSVTLTSSASTNNHWSTTATSNAITVTTSGTYYVYVTNGSGCSSSNSLPVTVTVNPIPSAPVITASGPLTFCAGQNVVLSSSYSTGNSWSNGNPSNSITVSNSGTYFVFYTDANGCVSPNSSSVITTVNSNPPIPTISIGGPSTICQGSNVTLTSSSAINNQWSTGPFTQSISVSVSGSYTVSVNNAFGCISTSAPANITVITTPSTPVISASGPLTFCEGDSILLSSSVPNTLWSTGDPDQQIYVSQTGVYSAVQVVSGCFSANSNIISVTVNPGPDQPSIVFLGDTVVCEGEDVTLFVNSTSPYIWSTGDTTQVIDVLTTGDYYVTATAPNGCQKTSDTVSITVVDNPTINFPFVANTCPLDPPFELNMATPPGGVYTGAGVNTGFFTPQNAGLGNHIITYTYTSPEGCIGDGIQVFEVESCLGIDDNDKFNLSVYPNPTNSLTSISSSNIIDQVRVYDEKGKLIYTYNPNSLTTEVNLSPYESGMYFVSIKFVDTDETKIIRVVKTP